MKYPEEKFNKEEDKIDTSSLYYIAAIILAVCLGGLLYLALGSNNTFAAGNTERTFSNDNFNYVYENLDYIEPTSQEYINGEWVYPIYICTQNSLDGYLTGYPYFLRIWDRTPITEEGWNTGIATTALEDLGNNLYRFAGNQNTDYYAFAITTNLSSPYTFVDMGNSIIVSNSTISDCANAFGPSENAIRIVSPSGEGYTSANGRIEFSLNYDILPTELSGPFLYDIEVWAKKKNNDDVTTLGLLAQKDLGYIANATTTATSTFWSDNLVEPETVEWSDFKAYLSRGGTLIATSTVSTTTVSIIGSQSGNESYQQAVSDLDNWLLGLETDFDTSTSTSIWYVDCSDYGFATSTFPMFEYADIFGVDLVPVPTENFIDGSICYANKTFRGIVATLFVPSDGSSDFLFASFDSFKQVFPFNIYFSFLDFGIDLVENDVYGDYSTASSTLVLEFPFMGETYDITLLTPTFLHDTIGESEADTVFSAIKVFLWLVFALVLFTMLRRMI